MDADCTEKNYGEFFGAQKTAAHYALMAITESSNKVSSSSDSKLDCVECNQLKFRIKELTEENLNLKADVGPLQRSIDSLRQKEKNFLSTIENYKKDVSELSKTLANKQIAINNYINEVEDTKKQLAIVNCDYEKIRKKLESYLNCKYVLDHIVEHSDKEGFSTSP